MDKLDELIQELKEMNCHLRSLLLNNNQLLKIPQAAKALGISPAILRQLIKKGIIPAGTTNENPKMQHFLVNIEQARKSMDAGGYLQKSIRATKSPKAPGRKSTKTLSI